MKSEYNKMRLLFFLALLMPIALVFGLLYNQQDYRNSAYRTAGQQGRDALQSGKPAPVVALSDQGPKSNPKPERDEWREEKDLEAQIDMAQWALFMLVATIIGVVVTGTGVCYVKKTLEETREAVRQTAIASQATVRAVKVAEDQVAITLKATEQQSHDLAQSLAIARENAAAAMLTAQSTAEAVKQAQKNIETTRELERGRIACTLQENTIETIKTGIRRIVVFEYNNIGRTQARVVAIAVTVSDSDAAPIEKNGRLWASGGRRGGSPINRIPDLLEPDGPRQTQSMTIDGHENMKFIVDWIDYIDIFNEVHREPIRIKLRFSKGDADLSDYFSGIDWPDSREGEG